MDAIAAIVLLFLGIIPGLYLLVQYNTLLAQRGRLRESWSGVGAALRRRHDLVPRLVETARGRAPGEPDGLENLIALRDRCAADHDSVRSQSRNEAALVSALRTLLSGSTINDALQAELTDVERDIQDASRSYNGHVRAYRKKCESFPSSVIASMFGFHPAGPFEAGSAVREAPASPEA